MGVESWADWQISDVSELLEQAPVAAIVTDLDGRVRLWNRHAESTFGWPRPQAVGRPITELTVPPSDVEHANGIIDAVSSGRLWRGVFPARRQDGTTIDIEVVNAPVVDEDGRPVGILGMSIEIHRQRWRELVEQATDALSIHDADGTFRYASPAIVPLLGYAPASLAERNAFELIHPEDLEEVARTQQTLLAGHGPQTLDYRLRRQDGTYVWVEGTARWDADQRVLVVQLRSIRARRSLLQTLEHEREVATRLQELQLQQRQFLTTVAHRARHPMTAILGFSRLLSQLLPENVDPRLPQMIGRLNANVDELSELIENVTRSDLLARTAIPIDRRAIDLRGLTTDVIAQRSSDDGPISNDIPPSTQIWADPDMLERALTALVHNVVFHTPVGTPCRIHTQTHDHAVVIMVDDDGPGVPHAARDRIFEPFRHVQSDPANPGMGLGLYMVAEIAAAHDGHAWVEDSPTGGASFRIRIPQRDPTPTLAAPGPDSHATGTRTPRGIDQAGSVAAPVDDHGSQSARDADAD